MIPPRPFSISSKKIQGFSLVELMISIVLSLMLVLGVGSIFLASNKTMQASQASSKIQENTRLIMELLNRELREAGANPCSGSLEVGSSLKNQSSPFWEAWKGGVLGYEGNQEAPGTVFGTSLGHRVSGTDAIDIASATTDIANITEHMATGDAPLAVDTTASFSPNDLVFACDTAVGFLFQVSGISAGKLQHTDNAGSPGNCSKVFSYTDPCNNLATGYRFDKNAVVGKVTATRWFIGNNKEGTRSLYRALLFPSGASDVTVSNVTEIASGVQNMNIEYLQRGDAGYVEASSVVNWKNVVGVKITYRFQMQQNALGVDDGRIISRDMTQIVTVRNH